MLRCTKLRNPDVWYQMFILQNNTCRKTLEEVGYNATSSCHRDHSGQYQGNGAGNFNAFHCSVNIRILP
jgi:hypothetical protein